MRGLLIVGRLNEDQRFFQSRQSAKTFQNPYQENQNIGAKYF